MLKRLKFNFILLAMLSMTVTLVLAFTVVNITLRVRMTSRVDSIIQVLYDNGGSFPIAYKSDLFDDTIEDKKNDVIHNETPFQTRYYVAYVNLIDGDAIVTNGDYSHIAIKNIAGIQEQISTILERDSDKGYIDTYRYGKFATPYGFMLIVVDCKSDLNMVDTLLTITLVTITLCVVIVLVLLLVLSKRVLRPFEQNREKQRRFITDAGHELKTPIAIIQSNAEVMEMIDGENKWLANIKAQTNRMNTLVKGLIELSKMDEQVLSEKEKQKLILSQIVSDSVDSFCVPAQAKGIEISADIAPNVSIMGDLEDIVRLVGILLDNAIKYTDERMKISVKVFSKARRVFLIVSNTCAGLDRESVPKFFDRFYRSDESRNSHSGGYGIGLSMAQMIVQNHKGRIGATYTEDERIVFTVEF